MSGKPTKAQLRVLAYVRDNGPVSWWPLGIGVSHKATRYACKVAGWIESVPAEERRTMMEAWRLTDAGRAALTSE